MAQKAKAIPEGFRTLTPALVVRDGTKAIEFYKKAFGAEEVMRMPGPGGTGVMHAELRIGDSIFFLSDEFPGASCRSPESLKGTTQTVNMYVQDVDAAFQQAVNAGAKPLMPVADMFWGDRYGKVTDPFGHEWGMATHTQDLTPEQIEKGAAEFFAQMGKRQS